jgi:hypothetical protein
MTTTLVSPVSPVRFDPPSHMSASQVISASEYRELLVSHRRMERIVVPQERLRGLRDLDTGEVFVTDERRLFDNPR